MFNYKMVTILPISGLLGSLNEQIHIEHLDQYLTQLTLVSASKAIEVRFLKLKKQKTYQTYA